MECYNSTHHLAARVDPKRVNDYKIFFALVFLFSSHWVKKFFTDQSIVLFSSKVTLSLINAAPLIAPPMMIDS